MEGPGQEDFAWRCYQLAVTAGVALADSDPEQYSSVLEILPFLLTPSSRLPMPLFSVSRLLRGQAQSHMASATYSQVSLFL